MRTVLWIGLGLSIVGAFLEWRQGRKQGRGRSALIRAMPGLPIYGALLAGPAHPWLTWISLAAGMGALIYVMAAERPRVPWKTAPTLFFAAGIVCLAGMSFGPRAYLDAFFYGSIASLLLVLISVTWMLATALRRARAARA